MAKATGIDHLAVYVSDLEAAKKFFVEGLGLVPYADYGMSFS
jgi:catechol 2,3-dioxygenase-like lactoylglutathione lyase family enzyme